MWEVILTVLFQLVSWLFTKGKNDEKKLVLLEKWMKVLRKDFGASADMKANFDKMWTRVKKDTWKRT